MRCGRSWGLSSEARREGQTFSGASLLIRYVNFVKLPHTVFALPFALLGVLVASREHPVTWRTLGLVVLAFTCARFVALGFNRIADRDLDAKNPRTRARELPAGRLTPVQAWAAVLVAAALFLGAAWALLRRGGARRGVHRLGAPPGAAWKPVAARRGLLRCQRARQYRRVSRRVGGPNPVMKHGKRETGRGKRKAGESPRVPFPVSRFPSPPGPPRHPRRAPTPNRRGR